VLADLISGEWVNYLLLSAHLNEQPLTSERRMKKLALLALCFFGVCPTPSVGQTPTAVILPNAYVQFLDANGKPLAAGTVFFYTPGTTTAKTTWQDPYQTTANPNPIVLNGSGEALIWGSGIYRQVVYDVNNNMIWDQLTGGYNCVGGGAIPMGANGAIQYNNNGIFGGLPLGTAGQVLTANSSGTPSWQTPAGGSIGSITGLGAGVAAALALPLDGSGELVAENGATLNGPAINNPAISGGTWANPTFTGTVTFPAGGGGASTFSSIILTGATPNGPAGSIGYGNTTAVASQCGGYPYFANTACFVISINGVPAYIPYWN
jgi:hypothetical protein